MAISRIDIDKGVFKTQDPDSLRNSGFAIDLVNQFIDQAGTNYDRPSLEAWVTLDSIAPIGITVFKERVVVVTNDRKVYSITSGGTATDVTSTQLPGTARPTFATDGDTLLIAGGGTPIKWVGVGETTAALDGSPPAATHLIYLDDYIMANRRLSSENNKVIQFSDNGTIETWTATNIFSNVAEPDETQGLALSQRELYAVGEETTEIWQDIGALPIPFARSFIWNYGTPAPYSIISAENSVLFLDQKKNILRFSGRQFADVSGSISDELATFTTVSDCWSGSFIWNGSRHVLFVFPTEEKAWSIDLRNNQWSEWSGYDEQLARVRLNSLYWDEAAGIGYAGDYLTGNVYKLSSTTKTDAGGIFVRQRTTSVRDGGGSVRKRANWLRFNLDRNVASAYSGTTSETNPTLELRWKDDNKPWTSWRRGSLGTKGNIAEYLEFRRLGIYRQRKYQYRMTDPSELSIRSIDTDEDVMTS